MDVKDIKARKVYKTKWNVDGKETIARAFEDGRDIISSYIYEMKTFKEVGNQGSSLNSSIKYTIPATPEEIQWLEACEKAGKFIKKEKVKFFKIHELWY